MLAFNCVTLFVSHSIAQLVVSCWCVITCGQPYLLAGLLVDLNSPHIIVCGKGILKVLFFSATYDFTCALMSFIW
jgi:hypothetical protein